MRSLRLRGSNPPSPSLEQLLDEQVDRLDRLIGEVRGGIRGPAHYDHLEECAESIASGIRRAFRTCPSRAGQ